MSKWIRESNRWKHLAGGFVLAVVFTILCTLGAAGAMEFKDCHHANGDKPFREWDWSSWDWLDFLSTMIGGIAGQSVQMAIIWLLFINV